MTCLWYIQFVNYTENRKLYQTDVLFIANTGKGNAIVWNLISELQFFWHLKAIKIIWKLPNRAFW